VVITPPDKCFPRAIAHIDADAFFASVAQALEPRLLGKPVITGQERGVITSASYEAKAFGVKRGVPLWEARRMCPGLILVETDFRSCHIFSTRMFDIIRTFTPLVESGGLDEGFADLRGTRELHHLDYPEIIDKMRQAIQRDLGITVSIGLATSKILAKICSAWRKPNQTTRLPLADIPQFLKSLPLQRVAGIGGRTLPKLASYGIHTGADYVARPQHFYQKKLGKPGVDLWYELQGQSVSPVSTAPLPPQQSIMKSATFWPDSVLRHVVYAHLLKNLSAACDKSRRLGLIPQRLALMLKTQQFQRSWAEHAIFPPCADTLALTGVVRTLFETLFDPDASYRATGVVLSDLKPENPLQTSLFDSLAQRERQTRLSQKIDQLNHKFGQHTVYLAGMQPVAPSPLKSDFYNRGKLPVLKTGY